LAWQVGEDGHARAGPGTRLAERELERGAEAGRRVERCKGVETLADAVRVGGPPEHHVGPVRSRDEHGLVARGERVEESTGPAAGDVEPRLARLARLHACRDVEDEDEAAARRTRVGALHVRAEVPADEGEEEEELEQEERVGTEAAAVERARGDLLPQKEGADGDHPPPAVVELEGDEHRNGNKAELARGDESALELRRPSATPRHTTSVPE